MKEKKGFRIYKENRIRIAGKVDGESLPHTNIQMDGGFKCAHGCYIPETSVDSNRAPYCSVFYNYRVVELTEAT